jgi:hypothetical protein
MGRPGRRALRGAATEAGTIRRGRSRISEVRIEDRIAIGASTLEVWHALEDPAIHARWHPFVTEIAGEHSLGQVRTCSVLVGRRHGETKEPNNLLVRAMLPIVRRRFHLPLIARLVREVAGA